jgi:hypothetical protein
MLDPPDASRVLFTGQDHGSGLWKSCFSAEWTGIVTDIDLDERGPSFGILYLITACLECSPALVPSMLGGLYGPVHRNPPS